MSDIAIRVENLSKLYHIGATQPRHDTLRDALVGVLPRISRMKKTEEIRGNPSNPWQKEDTNLWALRDVSFDVKQGEVVGIIGRNGAGKSTLLKILSRITEPTSGRVTLHGRVASLLEVGTGFHPELTGRENIYLNGAILGMKRQEIDHKFDEIVAFAEIERFLDTPVKRYSSGMYVRLAFAVAAHLEPEILLVDEVLAVGDTEFQKKCLGKMDSVAKEGRTVIFVSHNMTAIQNLCGSGLVLQDGEVRYSGNAREVVEKYLHTASSRNYGSANLTHHSGRPNGMPAIIQSISVRPRGSVEPNQSIKTGDSVTFEIGYDCRDLKLDYAAIGICSSLGERVITVGTHLCPDFNMTMAGQGTLECTLIDLPLAEGEYNVLVALGSRLPMQNVDYVENALNFAVDTGDYFGTGITLLRGQGYFAQRSQWKISNGEGKTPE